MIDSGTVGLGAIGVAVVVEGLGGAFWAGIISNKIKNLEEDVKPVSSLKTDLARLEERMKHLIDLLEKKRGR
jgi:hypothetical protein